MRLAILQAQARVMDPDHNLALIDDAAAEAAADGAEVLLTPELFVSGYAPARVSREFTAEQGRQARDRLARTAREAGIALVASLPVPAPDGRVRIGAVLFGADGEELLSYDKVHLFGAEERSSFAASSAPPRSVQLGDTRVGIVVCYDVEFPESVRAVADAGAEVVLVPTALAPGFDPVASVLVPARALENHVTVAYANHTGVEDGLAFSGNSVIADPFGVILARGGDTAEIVHADIDPAAGQRADAAVPYREDRRPGLYAQWRQDLHDA